MNDVQPIDLHEDLGVLAYIYAFPLVFDLLQVTRYVQTGVGANPPADYNTFSHARTLATPEDRFVTINNDTVYSFAQIDLGVGPVVLQVPETHGIYYVFQFISAWTDNFAYVGRRSTGSGAGRFLLVPPGADHEVSDDTVVIRFPTRVATVNGRWSVSDPAELPAVHALQDSTTLTPQASVAPSGVPIVADLGDEALTFWERYRVWSQEFAPAERDEELQRTIGAELGLDGATSVADAPPALQERLREAYRRGQQFVAASLRGGHTPVVNGWQITLHAFDYNLDHFEIGTNDSTEWRITDPDERLIMRAGAALGGLWGNHAYEAAYFTTYADHLGEQLNGRHTYQLTLDPPPPNDAFWSLTMYDATDYFLVDNPIDRYSIGDRTPGLHVDASGALTITMSNREPTDPAARANWLPAPADDFRPTLRVYVPDESVLDGGYSLPAIRRVDLGDAEE